jgi:hypothetical protein
MALKDQLVLKEHQELLELKAHKAVVVQQEHPVL